ncbi:tetratricopeptide repeat protein [Telmatospirillum siberiense]|nr:tetratricopeptide repeat protein [Telmatospirillum siberiense]
MTSVAALRRSWASAGPWLVSIIGILFVGVYLFDGQFPFVSHAGSSVPVRGLERSLPAVPAVTEAAPLLVEPVSMPPAISLPQPITLPPIGVEAAETATNPSPLRFPEDGVARAEPSSRPIPDPAAQLALALNLLEDQSQPSNAAKAVGLLRGAAEAGLADAQFHLGYAYRRGIGASPDPVEAAGWYRRAAEQRHWLAAYHLAVSYAEGAGVPQNFETAAEWFRKAADGGVVAAQFNFATLCLQGNGVPRDPYLALKYYSLAANAGDAEARTQAAAITQALRQSAESRRPPVAGQ